MRVGDEVMDGGGGGGCVVWWLSLELGVARRSDTKSYKGEENQTAAAEAERRSTTQHVMRRGGYARGGMGA